MAKSTSADTPARASLYLSLALLVSLGTLWGGQTVLAKFVTTSGVPPFGYAFWQSFGAGIVLLTVCFLRGSPPPLSLRHLRYYVIVGWTGSAIPTANLYVALSEIPAGVMAVVITTSPLLTYLMALGVRMEGFDLRRALGIAVGFAGALLLLLPKGSLPDTAMVPFVALGFLSPLFYSISSIYASRAQPPECDPMQVAAGMMLSSSALMLPVSLGTGTFHPLWLTLNLPNGLIIAHIFLTALTFFLYFTLLRRAGPVYFSQVAYIVTITAIVWGMVLLGERHSAWIWGAVALVLGGVALVNLRHAAVQRAQRGS